MPVVRRCQADAKAGVGYIPSKCNDTLANQKPKKVKKGILQQKAPQQRSHMTDNDLLLNIILEYKGNKTNCSSGEGCHKIAI